jgi:hypothetical protein
VPVETCQYACFACLSALLAYLGSNHQSVAILIDRSAKRRSNMIETLARQTLLSSRIA